MSKKSKPNKKNFRKLLAKRIDLVRADLDVGYFLLQKHFPPEAVQRVTHHHKPLMALPLHLIVSKKVSRGQYWIEAFNKGLKQLKSSGQYELYFQESRAGKYTQMKGLV